MNSEWLNSMKPERTNIVKEKLKVGRNLNSLAVSYLCITHSN